MASVASMGSVGSLSTSSIGEGSRGKKALEDVLGLSQPPRPASAPPLPTGGTGGRKSPSLSLGGSSTVSSPGHQALVDALTQAGSQDHDGNSVYGWRGSQNRDSQA